ncbi:MAG: sulfatase-like hydrolase/transferase [Planctomycetes bacterium]|nr:sulfatase-like hydrolase/transferase [Planctomycetota bacterium]
MLIIGLTLVLVGFVPAQEPATSPGSTLPNVVYILADDMGCGDVSCLNPDAAWKTPHLDRVASEGMVFVDAHSGSSVCTPTRYGILTGRYAWRSRLKRGVLGGASRHLIPSDRMTVASFLKSQGYHSACIGKWHLGWDFAMNPDEPASIDFGGPVTNGPRSLGFDHDYCLNGSLDMGPYVYVEDGRVTAAPDRTTKNDDFQGFWRAGPTGADFVHEDVLGNFTRRGVTYVQERAKSKAPFFLYLALTAPHTPILPTKSFQGRSKTNAYGDFVLQVDDAVGQLMRAVDEAGVTENTIFIVTADNGCSPRARFEELETFGHRPSGPYRGAKADIFEGGHRVPFMVRWPRRVAATTRSSQTICLTDLLRTLADVVGEPLPDDAGEDSVSFYPSLVGADQPTGREAIVHHSINGSFAIRRGPWKLILCPGSGGWSAPRPKAAREQRLPLEQLYNLDDDPGERTNLAGTEPKIVKELTLLLGHYVEEGRSTPGPRQANEGDVEFLPQPYPKTVAAAFDRSEVVYKTVGETELKLHLFRPRGVHRPMPAIVFFFGGGWRGGTPKQFFPHCEDLAAQGILAMAAEYRVASTHGATPFDCVADARSAIRFLRRQADELGLDPDRIVAGGGSAGGHLAAATGTVEIPADESEAELLHSSRPNAMVLFNPVFDNGPKGYGYERIGDRYLEISPIHNLKSAIAPTIIFLGTEDQLVPVATAEKYRDLMVASGNECDLRLYPGQPHGFFNYRDGKNPFYRQTMDATIAFLKSHGY